MNRTLTIFILLFFGCNTYENKMNILLSQKKQLEDSISYINLNVNRFDKLLRSAIVDRTFDTKIHTFDEKMKESQKQDILLSDSIRYFEQKNIVQQEALKKIVYSIDSLSKLK